MLKNVVEDVLKVKQLRGVADVDKLCSDLPVHTRGLVIGDPKFRRRTRNGGRAMSDGGASGHVDGVKREKGKDS